MRRVRWWNGWWSPGIWLSRKTVAGIADPGNAAAGSAGAGRIYRPDQMGETLNVVIKALRKTLRSGGEIVPAADPTTRSFMVKVDLPETEGLYPGMFGRLLVPVGKISVVWIPGRALERVGQLEMVRVKSHEGWAESM
jgi:multidrug efflux pump subunit AcrA (membrane-fusion protein)